jgi:AdoMet-dependent rRNA methyltransferase SPB1
VIANFSDLKVLGKGDFKLLMKWRLAIRLEVGIDVKAVPTEETTEEITVEPIDEEQQISEEVNRFLLSCYGTAMLMPLVTKTS